METYVELRIDAKLAYRKKGDADDDGKPYAAAVEKRTLECDLPNKIPGYHYNCTIAHLFELGSLHHDYYLLNIRFPVDTEKEINTGLGHIHGLWLVAINQNGGFTMVWVSMKTIFFPIVIAIMVWFWRRVHMLQRKPALLEKMLLLLGSTLTLLNAPFEYLTLFFDMPYMLLLADIKQGAWPWPNFKTFSYLFICRYWKNLHLDHTLSGLFRLKTIIKRNHRFLPQSVVLVRCCLQDFPFLQD